MYLETRSLFTGVITLFTVERLFTRMNSHVRLEIANLCAGVFALFAFEGLLSAMNEHVLPQITIV